MIKFKLSAQNQKYITVTSQNKVNRISNDKIGNFCCPKCSLLISESQKQNNNHWCPNCNYYFSLNVWERIYFLCDSNSFKEINSNF